MCSRHDVPPPLPASKPPSLASGGKKSSKGILKVPLRSSSYSVTDPSSPDTMDANTLRNTKDNEFANVYRQIGHPREPPPPLPPPRGQQHQQSYRSSLTISPTKGGRGVGSDHSSPEDPTAVVTADRDVVEVAVTAVKWAPVTTPSPEKSAKANKDLLFSSDVLRGESVGLYKRPLSDHFPLELPAKNTNQQVGIQNAFVSPLIC